MNKLSCLFLILMACSCGMLPERYPKEGKKTFHYSDISGQYQLHREYKKVNNTVVTRTVLIDSGAGSKIVEKSITVSQLGSVKGRKGRVMVMRPQASEFVVWLEGKKYESKLKINSKKKSMTVSMDGPESKWQGVKEIPFPKSHNFCFFSQLPECLYHTQQLTRALNNSQQEIGFYVVWDSFPFTSEQYSNAGKELFAPAILRFEAEDRGLLRFLVEVDGQIVLYHFSKSFDLAKISWIAQGISVVPLGEAVNAIDE